MCRKRRSTRLAEGSFRTGPDGVRKSIWIIEAVIEIYVDMTYLVPDDRPERRTVGEKNA